MQLSVFFVCLEENGKIHVETGAGCSFAADIMGFVGGALMSGTRHREDGQ